MPLDSSASYSGNEIEDDEEVEDEKKGNKHEDISETWSGNVLPTLPNNFECNTTAALNIESEKPHRLIELIGNFLGVTDYKTNMASFWFLDTLSLQLLRHEAVLNETQRGVFISWLAGEMKLIRDFQLPRDDFLNLMKEIFIAVDEKISQGEELSHWKSMILRPPISKMVSKRRETNSTMTVNQQETFANQETGVIRSGEPIDELLASTGKRLGNRAETNSFSKKVEREGPSESSDDRQEHVNSKGCEVVLDAIIQATYDMYAGDLRYFLVYSTFVEPMELITYHLPSTYRVPRKIKSAEEYESFDLQIQKALGRQNIFEEKEGKGASSKKKEKGKEKTSKKKVFEGLEAPAPPPTSPTDEEKLYLRRRFILPLIESIEAREILNKDDSS